MLWVYRLLFLPLAAVSAPYYLWRMRRRGGYRQGFGQRFGAVPPLPARRPGVRRIWIQAVSVGELLAIEPVIGALAADPTIEIYLTTTTSTGYRLAQERYAGRVLAIAYFPLDAWPCSARAWARIEPDLAVLTEGERWPEHLAQARRRRVPLLCINARLSDRSFRRLRTWAAVVHPLIGGIDRLLAASAHDAERFRALGYEASRLTVTGNLKLDVELTRRPDAEIAALRTELGLGTEDLVILGSSTWPGEEAALLDAFARIRAGGQRCRLLLVPRHAERRAELAALLAERGWTHHFRSSGRAPGEVEVAVGDTTGELRRLTQVAAVAFVGKSLPPHHEGQTPVEAAGLGVPVLFGPEMSNFRVIAQELTAEGAARRVDSPAALTDALTQLVAAPAERSEMGAAGRRWHERNRGALARTLAAIRDSLPKT